MSLAAISPSPAGCERNRTKGWPLQAAVRGPFIEPWCNSGEFGGWSSAGAADPRQRSLGIPDQIADKIRRRPDVRDEVNRLAGQTGTGGSSPRSIAC
jgi:hypothetical protein